MTVFMGKFITCTCGSTICVVSGDVQRETISALRASLEQAGAELLLLTGETCITCGSCGKEYFAPSPETFDTERHELGAWLQEIEQDKDKHE